MTKGFLGNVFALRDAACCAVSEGADQRLVTGNDLFEGAAIPTGFR